MSALEKLNNLSFHLGNKILRVTMEKKCAYTSLNKHSILQHRGLHLILINSCKYNHKIGGFILDIFTQDVNLNVEQDLLEQTKQELSLPFVINHEKLKEVLSTAYSMARVASDFNKNHSLREWLFAVMVTYKELETSIIYGNAKKPTEMNREWYDEAFNQPFYDAPCSFFASQSVSLAFSLGEKIAQFVNQLEDINLPITGVSLYKFSSDEKVNTEISPRNSDYKNSVLHTKLKELSDSLTPLKETRHSKAHRLDSEITTATTTVSEGLKNGTEPITVVISRIDTDRLPIPPIQTLKKVKTFFEEATTILDEIFNIAILKL